MNFNKPLDVANYALDMGLKIFPVCAAGAKRDGGLIDKTPATNNWQDWALNTPPHKIMSYARSNKTTNFAVHCGHSNIVIIDVDTKGGKEGPENLALLEQEHNTKFTDTFTVMTPSGGFHHYFKTDKKITGGNNKLGNGIDVQAGGKYALLFGSEIETGKTKDGKEQKGGRYITLNENPVLELPDWIAEAIKPKDLGKEYTSEGKIETPEVPEDLPGQVLSAKRLLLEKIPPCVEGAAEFNGEYLYQVFLQVRDQGVSKDQAYQLVEDFYNPRCDPPWNLADVSDAQHFEAKLENAYKFAQHSNLGAKSGEAKEIEYQKAFDVDPDVIAETEAAIEHENLYGWYRDRLEFIGEPEPRRWLIDEWLPKGEISSLYGSGGAGKSLLALQMAYAVSSGVPFMGLSVSQVMPVLYVACEDDWSEIHRRMLAIERASEYEDLKTIANLELKLWSRVGMLNDIAREDPQSGDVVAGNFKPVLEQACQKIGGPMLLILDTLSDIYLGDENVRQKVNKFIKTHIGGLVKKYDLTVLMLAHPSRSGQTTKDMLSGSTAWNNSVRNRLVFNTSEANPALMALTRFKSNYAKAGEEIDLEWVNGRFTQVNKTDATVRAISADQRDMLHAMHDLYKPGQIISLVSVAQRLGTDPVLAHLFGGRHYTVIFKKLQTLLQYTRTIHDVDFSAVNGPREGERALWWLHVTTTEQTEKIYDQETPDELREEEKRLDMIDNLDFFN